MAAENLVIPSFEGKLRFEGFIPVTQITGEGTEKYKEFRSPPGGRGAGERTRSVYRRARN